MVIEQLKNKDNISRIELADAIAEKSGEHQHFLLECAPRVGKSIQAIELVKRWNLYPFLILSGANATNQQWIKNISEYNPDLNFKYDIQCYQSLHKIPRDYYKVILLDEFDLVTEQRLAQLQEFKPEHWIGMSGTLEDSDVFNFRSLARKFFHVKVDLLQAVKWGILPVPTIFNVALELDNTKRYLVYHKGKDKKKKNNIVPYNERWNAFKDKTKNALIQCTEVEYNSLINEEFQRWKNYEEQFELPPEERDSSIQFLIQKGFNQSTCRDKKLRIGNERKKFYADIKNRWFKKLFAQLPSNKRILVFCNDTAQADLLNEEFSVHSNRPGSEGLVESFNNKEINLLFSCKMLERGVDFIDVDYLIIVQSSGSQGSQTQKAFRIMLSQVPKIILFHYPNTQDELYVNKFLEGFKPEWIIKKTL